MTVFHKLFKAQQRQKKEHPIALNVFEFVSVARVCAAAMLYNQQEANRKELNSICTVCVCVHVSVCTSVCVCATVSPRGDDKSPSYLLKSNLK